MNVYHGSYTAIYEIDLSKCEPKRDFGQGFYVTKFREQAEFWAIRKGSRQQAESVVTEFEFDEEAYRDKSLKILRFDGYDDEWFDFVIQNRKTGAIFHHYDMVEGPVADDKIQNRIMQFMEGKITREDFFNQLKHPKPSHQICFCTVNSLKTLKTTNYKIIFSVEDIGELVMEQLATEQDMEATKIADLFFSSSTFGKLSDVATGLYRKSWQEIYRMLKDELKG
jgi:hypothetical protein